MKLKHARVPRGYDGLHCEVDGCIVNIYTGLHDTEGREVTTIQVICDRYAGEPGWFIPGEEKGQAWAVRVVREGGGE